jgi:hypothetical protein
MPQPEKERSFVAALLRMTDEIPNRETGVQIDPLADTVPKRGAASSAPTDDQLPGGDDEGRYGVPCGSRLAFLAD